MSIYIYICLYVCMYVCMYVYIYIYCMSVVFGASSFVSLASSRQCRRGQGRRRPAAEPYAAEGDAERLGVVANFYCAPEFFNWRYQYVYIHRYIYIYLHIHIHPHAHV